MENINCAQKSSVPDIKIKINQTSYRGFISIDQEMGREIALNFLKPLKKTIPCHKGFVFTKREN